ncbi:3-ketosteroid-9-alpha-hydroxylase [Endozoicomonas sp. OPT23]|nr:3-ketosteroid-9-alpha-hydroxylase [Endozoicomonas sp. OPT23]
MTGSRYHNLEVADVITETHDSKSVVFSVPGDYQDDFDYLPGQFLTLKVPFDGQELIRCYSLASSPDVDDVHKVTIKRVDGGRISNWINDEVKPGDRIEVMPPAGLFYLNEGTNDIVLFGGGSGITPVISILKSALTTTDRKVKLVYANRDEQSVIFRKELKKMEHKYIDRLSVIYVYDSIHGFVSRQMVKGATAGSDGAEFYICGPGPFMDTVESSLLEQGEDRSRIHVERFSSPVDPDQEAALEAEAAAAAESSTVTGFKVELDGENYQVAHESGDTVLQSMLKAGIAAPFSCEKGMCGACMCSVEGGETSLGINQILEQEEVDEGWTLACQCHPVSGDLTVKFPD